MLDHADECADNRHIWRRDSNHGNEFHNRHFHRKPDDYKCSGRSRWRVIHKPTSNYSTDKDASNHKPCAGNKRLCLLCTGSKPVDGKRGDKPDAARLFNQRVFYSAFDKSNDCAESDHIVFTALDVRAVARTKYQRVFRELNHQQKAKL